MKGLVVKSHERYQQELGNDEQHDWAVYGQVFVELKPDGRGVWHAQLGEACASPSAQAVEVAVEYGGGTGPGSGAESESEIMAWQEPDGTVKTVEDYAVENLAQ